MRWFAGGIGCRDLVDIPSESAPLLRRCRRRRPSGLRRNTVTQVIQMGAVSGAVRLEAFVESMKAELGEQQRAGAQLPIQKRLLSTVLTACGTKASTNALERIGKRLEAEGIYTEPPLSAPGLRRGAWILFSTGPFPADSLLFSSERELQRFIEACIGSGVFRDLRPYHEGRKNMSREYRVPSDKRIDLLCEVKSRTGDGALVAIELKRERERGTVDQMVEYLDELATVFPARTVRGLIVTGREDRVGAAMRRAADRYEIDWYCYKVSFEKIPDATE